MYTLQILDRGQTFLHPLDDRPVRIGSAADADLRLQEAEVEAAHARIEPTGSAPRLIASARVLVNGAPVETAVLALGDRIEIGRAVLVVGKPVARPASPDDVLADVRPRVARRRRGGLGTIVAVVMAVALFGVAFHLVTKASGDSIQVREAIADVSRAVHAGEVERAASAIDGLRRQWQGATDDRLQRLAEEQELLDAVRNQIARLERLVLDPAIERTALQWKEDMQTRVREAELAESIAARHVLETLTDTLVKRIRSRPPVLPPANQLVDHGNDRPNESSPPPAVAESTPAPTAPAASPRRADPAPQPAPAVATGPDAESVAAAQRLAALGQFAQALATLEAAAGDMTDAAALQRVLQAGKEVRASAVRAMDVLLTGAQNQRQQGKHQEVAAALAAARGRFPDGPEFAPLGAAQRDAEAAVAAADAARRDAARPGAATLATRQNTLSTLRTLLDAVRAAEEHCAFAEAAAKLREGANLVRERDADFAGRLEGRADELALLAEWHDCVAARLRAGDKLPIVLRTGAKATLVGVDGTSLLAEGDQKVGWNDIAPIGVQALVDQCKAQGRAVLGAATLLYKNGETTLAEAALAKLLRADPSAKDAVDRVVAHGRGEPVDPRGYTLGKDGFVSQRSVDAQKQGAKLQTRLDALLRGKDQAARDAFVGEVLAGGADGLAALVAAFQKEFSQQLAKLSGSPLKRQVDRLTAQRDELDRVRKFAKDLIYDEVTYFYPYKPPAVSPEKFAEYNRVQAEVDRRVAAVRAIWRDDRLRIKIPAALQGDLDRLDWVAKVLADLGELDPSRLDQVAWARALPPGDSVGIAEFCRTPAERAELEEWRCIEALNTVVGKRLSAPQRELLRITNDYRAMFRHRPLAISEKISSASQGHAEEMSKLGYFAHFSPTPGRRTPFDRMKLAGYEFGVSENIALHDSAPGAHDAWCHSSGHHRNLLNPSHREMGIGVDGRNWVENFGAGSTYVDQPAWTGPRPKAGPERH